MFKAENDALMTAFLERTFYTGFRNPDDEKYQNFRSIEFILTYKCNLGCKYCYVNKFGDQLYSPELYSNDETLLKNLRMVLRWMKENKFYPKIEIFTAEAFVQPVAFKALDMIIDELGEEERRRIVVIPTNLTFLLNENLTEKVEGLIRKGRENNVELILSASFDGKYCESNRPFRGNVKSHSISPVRAWSWKYGDLVDPRDDAYYDKAFAFVKKWGFGFHPMVYSDGIEKWKENFLWFQENFEKVEHPWMFLYLLEVRNVEWSTQQIRDYAEFIKFLWRWAYKKCGNNTEKLLKFIFGQKGFNILQSPLSTVGRGIGCSIQGTLMVRLGDLAIVPCHRTCYEPFIYGKFKTKDDLQEISEYKRKDGTIVEEYTRDASRIVGVEANNMELMIGMYSVDSKNFPYCQSCLISPLCNRGCFGSQYEVTGDLFTPIPTVCMMYHAKMKAIIEVFDELGITDVILSKINQDKREALLTIRKMIKQ